MKSVIVIFAMFASSMAHAQINIGHGADQMYTIVDCHNLNHLPSGLSLKIEQGGIAGFTIATLTNRDNLGPYVTLETIMVKEKVAKKRLLGAPRVYVGKNFKLTINVDSPSQNGMHASYLEASVEGRSFSQAMNCSLEHSPLILK